MSLLIILAHPGLPHSRVNAALLARARALPAVSVLDLYGTYPDFFIDGPAERQRLLAHDTLILQHPLHWYSVPSLLKHWIDEVLVEGWAYGKDGTRLAGKRWGHALSTAGSARAYSTQGRHGHPLDDFLLPLQRTASLCNAHWIAPFVTHDADDLDAQGITSAAERYANYLQALLADSPAV